MKKLLIYFLISLLPVTTLTTLLTIVPTEHVEAQARTWTTGTYGNGSQQAYFYTPPNYNSRTDWPVVVFLHGQGEMGSTIGNVDNTGLAQQLANGMDLPCVVICPQLQSGGAGNWTASISLIAYNWVTTHYNIDLNQVYFSGLSLGGSGTMDFVCAYPSKVAAAIPVSGGTYTTTTAESDSAAKVPHWLPTGFNDPTQSPSNAWQMIDSMISTHRTSVPILPRGEFPWGLAHSQDMWDVVVYENFDDKYMPWLLLHHKSWDTTALNYVDSAERATTSKARYAMYWKSLRLVNTLSASIHKTNMEERLADVKDDMYGEGYTKVILDLAVSGKSSTTGVNNLTNGNTGQTYTNLVDESAANTGWTFTVVADGVADPEEVAYGDLASYFGGHPNVVYNDAWDIFDNPNSCVWRLSLLDNTKQYQIRISGSLAASDVTPSYSYQRGFVITINGVSDTLRQQYKNTDEFIEFVGISPASGIINIAVKSLQNDGHGYVAFVEVVEEGTHTVGENTLPSASAGPDQSIRLPVDGVTMAGSSSDADGTIASNTWTKISGPATYTITTASSLTTTITGLVEGVYVFRLTAIDDEAGEATDDVQITVLNAFHQSPTISSEGLSTNVPAISLSATYETPSDDFEEIRVTKLKATGQPLFTVIAAGSSTTQGVSITTADSCFVKLVQEYYQALGIVDTIYNKGVSATNVFATNITTTLNTGGGTADVLLLNFPSNDYNGSTWTVQQIAERHQAWADSCANRGIQFYVTGTQPREDFSAPDRVKLNVINDTLRNRFGDRFIDFMSILKDSVNNDFKIEYDYAADDIHASGPGHAKLADAVIARNIFQNLVSSTSVIESPDESTTVISGLESGTHLFQFSVLDASGFAATKVDTVVVDLTPPPCVGVRRDVSLGSYNSLDLSFVQPGDTIFFQAGSYGFTELKNLNGTAGCPIRVTNEGGQVELDALNVEFPGQYIIIDGRGHTGTDYGFYIANSNYFGMHVKCQGPFEAFNIEIDSVQLGIQLKYGDGTLPSGLTQHTDFSFHNMYIHNIHGSEGMYMGSSTTPTYPKVIGLHIYDVLIDSTAREGLQISNAHDVLVERVKIIDPSFANQGSQNHSFNLGHDFQGTAKNMYIQSAPSYNVFFSGGRTTFQQSTIEYMPGRGFTETLAIFGKNFEFDAATWDETYQQFTMTDIDIINGGGSGGGVNLTSITSEGPLQANVITNVKRRTGGTFTWSTGSPSATVTNVSTTATLDNTPPISTTMWTYNWPVTSPTESKVRRHLAKRPD